MGLTHSLTLEINEKFLLPTSTMEDWERLKQNPQCQDTLTTFLNLWPDFIKKEGEALLKEILKILEDLREGECALCGGHSPCLAAAAWLVTGQVQEVAMGEGFLFTLEDGKIQCRKL